MSTLASFGVRKPVVANLCMFALLAAGLFFGAGLRREFFPESRPTQVLISAPYPGANPDEVESSLARKIEDALDTIENIKELSTVVTEGSASVTIEFESGVRIESAVAEVKRQIDGLQDLPEDADRITVRELKPNLPAVALAIYGDADPREMKAAIQRIRDDLETMRGMGQISIGGVRVSEITVEVDPHAMLEYALSFPQISAIIREHMRELPGGVVRSGQQNYSVRIAASEERADTVRDIIVARGDSQRPVRLGEIATVREGFADVDLSARLNRSPAVNLTVFKVGDDDAVDIADMVKAYAAGINGEPLTPDLRSRTAEHELGRRRAELTPIPGTLVVTTDLSKYIVGRLNLLTRNALFGGALVFATLLLLLSWRTSFWVALGLLVSFGGALAGMHFLGVTLNLLSMFGLIIVLGLLVDDAIVVAENITARHEAGEKADIAAVRGTGMVTWPVVATVLTTICAFFPLLLVEGFIGDLLAALPQVVAIALIVSLIECLFILPAHMAHSLKAEDRRRQRDKPGRLERAERWYNAKRDGLIHRRVVPAYGAMLDLSVRRRFTTVLIAVSMLIASIGLFAGGRLPFVFFESTDAESLSGSLVMPVGAPLEQTVGVLKRFEAAALNQPEVKYVWAIAGQQIDPMGQAASVSQPHIGQLILELYPVEDRERASPEIRQAMLDEVGDLPEIKSFRIAESDGGPGGPALSYAVVGADPERIDRVVAEIKAEMRKFQGVFGIADDTDRGAPEIRIARILPQGEALGFTPGNLGQQIRAMVRGLEAYTFAGNREDVDVRVIAPRSVRESVEAIQRSFVFSPEGVPVPLIEVAEITEGSGYATLRRLDRRRAVTVTADIQTRVTNIEEVSAKLATEFERIERENPGIRILERGRQKDQAESFASLPIGMAVAVGLIYVILAWLFGSFVQPLIVMAAVPFAAIGMILGHMLLGFPLGFMSLIGFVALTGVVVNDSLIFMEFYNHLRREGMSVHEACRKAGRMRFRAIMLTTITTVLGLMPLMLEESFQARFLIPMAITISFGLMSATFIILLVLPCLLMILRDIQRAASGAWHGQWPPPIDAHDREHFEDMQRLEHLDEILAKEAPATTTIETLPGEAPKNPAPDNPSGDQ